MSDPETSYDVGGRVKSIPVSQSRSQNGPDFGGVMEDFAVSSSGPKKRTKGRHSLSSGPGIIDYEAELQKAHTEMAKKVLEVKAAETECAQLMREMRERDAAARKLQRISRGYVARKEVNAKVAARNKAVTDIARMTRGKQTRKKVDEIKAQRAKMARGRPVRQHSQADDGDEDEYDEFEDEEPTMTTEEAAEKIQRVMRGKLGRKRAKKQVKPFDLSIGGFDFNHRGGQKTIGESFYQPKLNLKNEKPKERKLLSMEDRNKDIGVTSAAELRQAALINNPDDEEMAIFSIIDADGDGFIGSEDLYEYLAEVGELPNYATVKDLIRELDIERNGKVSLEEFLVYMREMRQSDKAQKRSKEVTKKIDAATRRSYLIGRLNGDIGEGHHLNEEILPTRKKKAVEPVQIGFN